jgi:hypothetical protein
VAGAPVTDSTRPNPGVPPPPPIVAPLGFGLGVEDHDAGGADSEKPDDRSGSSNSFATLDNTASGIRPSE